VSLDPIGVAVPFFLILIGVEWLISRRKKRTVFRLNDSMINLACGIGDQLLGVLAKATLLVGYIWIYENHRFFELSASSWITWTIALIGGDFCFYWYHRFSHRTQIGWATHVVHHQSEEYNLAVALRQPWFSKVYSWMFFIPLALFGVPAEVYVASFAFNLLYQFWIHTRLIGQLGAFEWVFNTPSHHRVHHGINHEYLDKNYAGILIIWDRMFGTFESEREEPLYGTLAPIQSWNPLWVNFWPIGKVIRDSLRQKKLWHKLTLWLRLPGWNFEAGKVIQVPEFPPKGRGYDSDLGTKLTRYVMIQFVPLSFAVSVILLIKGVWSEMALGLSIGFILFTLCVVAGLYEKRGWAKPAEYIRLLLLAGAGVFGLVDGGVELWWGATQIGVAIVSLLIFVRTVTGQDFHPAT